MPAVMVHESNKEGLFVTKMSNMSDPLVGASTIRLRPLLLRNSKNI